MSSRDWWGRAEQRTPRPTKKARQERTSMAARRAVAPYQSHAIRVVCERSCLRNIAHRFRSSSSFFLWTPWASLRYAQIRPACRRRGVGRNAPGLCQRENNSHALEARPRRSHFSKSPRGVSQRDTGKRDGTRYRCLSRSERRDSKLCGTARRLTARDQSASRARQL